MIIAVVVVSPPLEFIKIYKFVTYFLFKVIFVLYLTTLLSARGREREREATRERKREARWREKNSP